MANKTQQECFVIMPISDPQGYETGHFKNVYEDVIIPACEKAGYKAIRADDVEETDLIHLSVLKKLIESPMAICDLSTRNPNVLFELGLRQAFDKLVVLIQEKGTERIFDISILRAYDYSKELKYKEVLEDQEAICRMLKGTERAFVTGEGFNSVIKLLALTKGAQVQSIDDPNEQLRMQLFQLSSQMDDVGSELKSFKYREIERQNQMNRDLRFKEQINTNEISNSFQEFLYFHNQGDYEGMKRIYEQVKFYQVLTIRDAQILDKMRIQMSEFQKRNTKE